MIVGSLGYFCVARPLCLIFYEELSVPVVILVMYSSELPEDGLYGPKQPFVRVTSTPLFLFKYQKQDATLQGLKGIVNNCSCTQFTVYINANFKLCKGK
jgi:hypothetical protein